jgi:hypothetical protein
MQPEFDLTPPAERHPHRPVRDTSIDAYTYGREHFEGRKADVLRALAAYYNARQQWPTAAELVRFEWPHLAVASPAFAVQTLTVRRGISDLIAVGVLAGHGARPCRVSGRKVETWQVIPAGRLR